MTLLGFDMAGKCLYIQECWRRFQQVVKSVCTQNCYYNLTPAIKYLTAHTVPSNGLILDWWTTPLLAAQSIKVKEQVLQCFMTATSILFYMSQTFTVQEYKTAWSDLITSRKYYLQTNQRLGYENQCIGISMILYNYIRK